MTGQEREPRTQETLVFGTLEEAREFRERVGERMRKGSGVVREREAVGQEVERELTRQGEAADTLSRPWEHTKKEHVEVQGLVNMAFDQDLTVALDKARKSESYPRNIDLLHDVLTGELYEAIQKRGVNRQKFFSWPVKVVLTVVVGTVLMILFLLLMTG